MTEQIGRRGFLRLLKGAVGISATLGISKAILLPAAERVAYNNNWFSCHPGYGPSPLLVLQEARRTDRILAAFLHGYREEARSG